MSGLQTFTLRNGLYVQWKPLSDKSRNDDVRRGLSNHLRNKKPETVVDLRKALASSKKFGRHVLNCGLDPNARPSEQLPSHAGLSGNAPAPHSSTTTANEAGASRGTKRHRTEADTPDTPNLVRQNIDEWVKQFEEEAQEAAEAAAAATGAAESAREHFIEWELKQALVEETERELQAAKEQLHQKRREQAEAVERLKQEQAQQLEGQIQAVKYAEEEVQQARRLADGLVESFCA